MRKALRIISIPVIICMLLSSCTVNLKRNSGAEEDIYEDKYDVIDKGPVKGGSLRLFSTAVDTLNPVLSNNTFVQDFLSLVFEGLYTLDDRQQPVPVLADSSSVSADGLTLTLNLKKNISWHDKMPFKADDVVFTINTIKDPKNNSIFQKNVANIDSVAASGGNAVVIRLKQPDSFIKYELTFPIIPVHHFVNEKIEQKNSKVNLTPIGTGPYRFNSYDPKTGVKLILNENWWNASGNKKTAVDTGTGESAASDNGSTGQADSGPELPYIPTVEVKILKNVDSANAAFQARDIDVLPAQYNEYRKYLGRTDISLKRYAGRNYEFLTLNLKKGPLADKRVRNALNYLINKKQLVDNAAPGIAVPAEIPVIPNSWVYQLTELDQAVDSNKARELMTQGGYVFDTKTNKYVKKTGKKALALKLIVNDDNSLRYNVANEISTQLLKAGITVQVVRLSWADVQKAIKSGSYDMAIMGYRISSVPDLSFAYSTANIATGLNVSGYSNPTVDGYLQQILANNDTEAQKGIFKNLLNTVLGDRPYIGLFFLNESMMYSRNIRGEVNPNVWNKYNNIVGWYIP